jgi:cytochrome c5
VFAIASLYRGGKQQIFLQYACRHTDEFFNIKLYGVLKMKKIVSVMVMSAALGLGGQVVAADGQAVYQKSCQACHVAGVAGAPKLGDKEAWAPRIATGIDAMLATAIKGKGAMPPKGTCMGCSDDDLKAAIEYMVSQSK